MKNWMKLAGILFLIVFLTSSCVSTQKMIYMQGLDAKALNSQTANMEYELRIQPDDQLSISISSKHPELLQPFINNFQVGAGPSATQSSSQSGMAYFQVDKDGYIHFPVLGDLFVRGMTHRGLQTMLEDKLKDGNFVKDASVTVKIMSFKVTVLGEVSSPGVLNLNKERLTLLEAIGMAGDLLPSGRRENITVLREENGVRTSYIVNLTDAKNVLQSPCYFLQQNDVIYVEPNDAIRVKGSASGSFLTLSSAVIGILASIVSLAFIIVK